MKRILSQPVLFNVITIVAMLFSLSQMVAVAHTSTDEIIAVFDRLVEQGKVEDETMPERLAAEQDHRAQQAVYVLAGMMTAILANVIANYIGRGRQHDNSLRIVELEAELRGLRAR